MRNLFVISISFLAIHVFAQTNFNPEVYHQFLKSNENLPVETFLTQSLPAIDYCNKIENAPDLNSFDYYDSICIKLNLTDSEKELLAKNQFMVSERLSHTNFGNAFHTVYANDLPVFITTDAILHAMHKSYDEILKDLEKYFMLPNLKTALSNMYNGFSTLYTKYKDEPNMLNALKDAEIYVHIAYSLINDSLYQVNYADSQKMTDLWEAIKNEGPLNFTLFGERARDYDFSQFKPRGHYADDPNEYDRKSLEPYFKCMMWLGRIDFWLTSPPVNPYTLQEMQELVASAACLNEVADNTGALELMNENDEIINYLVGKPDNMTPLQLKELMANGSYTIPQLMNDSVVFKQFQAELKASTLYQQKILSSMMFVDPYSSTPDEYPVSFKLMGQKFIIDSYILGNVIYDKIIFNDKKITRLMPSPLDAMHVLGNNNAGLLLKDEIEKYKYTQNITSLQYLVNQFDTEFWNESLYNLWLTSIRALNPVEDTTGLPFFMRTTAWQHEKLNTQLASWAQLRHDNLLYAKQSYSPMMGCSYPHGYVEPYPEFYAGISNFAKGAFTFFEKYETSISFAKTITRYFYTLDTICENLKVMAQKELNSEKFSEQESKFIENLIFANGYPYPEYSGWYTQLFYGYNQASEEDYIIADIHTQPTDEVGNPVGKVLHIGTGKINLGVFMAKAPCNEYKPTAYVGPVMSYYEHVTQGFKRLTDQEWEGKVKAGTIPQRPDWTNIYLADTAGTKKSGGIELPGKAYFYSPSISNSINKLIINNANNQFRLFKIKGESAIYLISLNSISENINLNIYNLNGQSLFQEDIAADNQMKFNKRLDLSGLSNGIYFLKVQTPTTVESFKFLK